MHVRFHQMEASDQSGVRWMMHALYTEDIDGSIINDELISRTFALHDAQRLNGTIYVFEPRDPDTYKDELAGYAIVCFIYSNELGGWVAVVDEIYVQPDWRSKGISCAFFEMLTQETAWKGIPVKAYELEVNPTNAHALEVFKKQGFQPSPRIHLYKLRT